MERFFNPHIHWNNIAIARNYIRKLLKGLDPHVASSPEEISPFVQRACVETLDRPLVIFQEIAKALLREGGGREQM